VLIPLANDGLLLWEALRRCPEGLVAALVSDEAASEALLRYASALETLERPQVAVFEARGISAASRGEPLPSPEQAAQWFSCSQFEHILIRANRLAAAPERIAAAAKPLLASGGALVLLASPPRLGEKISRILREECGAETELACALQNAEDAFFALPALADKTAAHDAGAASGANSDELLNWDGASLEAAFIAQDFSVQLETREQQEERLITEKDIARWFDPARSRWGAFMSQNLSPSDFNTALDLLRRRIQKGPLLWRWKSVLLKAEAPQMK
jgi:putative ATPase